MSAKLDTINTNLILSGNSAVESEDDGSPEWTVASAAYEAALKYLLGGHDWKFATQIVTLNRTGDSDDTNYDDAYAKPADCLGLQWVKIDGYAADWKIVGNKVLLSADGGTVQAKVVLAPADTEIPPLFDEALNCLVRAGCYEGLNEDPTEARTLRSEAEAKLALARSRDSRQDAPRRVRVSRMLLRRMGLTGPASP